MNRSLPLEYFDWDSFLDETLKNLQTIATDDLLVAKQVDEAVSFYKSGWLNKDLAEELATPDTRLFVSFAIDNLDNAVVLADGTTMIYSDPNDMSLDDEAELEDAQDHAEKDMIHTPSEAVGYLFKRRGEQLLITTGWLVRQSDNCPAMIKDLANHEELDLYGYAMERYIEQFILEAST